MTTEYPGIPDALLASTARELLRHLKLGAHIYATSGDDVCFACSIDGQISLTGLTFSYPKGVFVSMKDQ